MNMKHVLIVEDSPLVMKVIRHVASAELRFQPLFATSFAEAKQAYQANKASIFAALVDLNLPDAPDGEVVDFMLQQRVPTVVLTGSFDEARRDTLYSKGIVDYVTKEGRYSYSYAVNLVNKLDDNQSVKVLVVDDSATSREFISQLLKQNLFPVLTAANGIEAIKVILEHPDIRLLITDYNMPKMDGFELVRNLRHKYEKSDLVIMGLSAVGDSSLSARFIKNGANDFLAKPFNQEEFLCRVMHNVESLQLIARIRDTANKDHLTGVYNRRYFFEKGEAFCRAARENHTPLATAIIDLDNFAAVNDAYGYEMGDNVLQAVGERLRESFSRFLLARAGGQEFFLIMPGLNNEKAMTLLGRVREWVSNAPVIIGDERIAVSFSAGVTNRLAASLDIQLNIANELLNRAKDAGRNLIIGDDEDDAG